MGHIKEPPGIDLTVSPMPLSTEDRQILSAIIAKYKATGEVPKVVRTKKFDTVAKAKRSRVKKRLLPKSL